MGTVDKTHLKCDVIDDSVVNGIREPILFSFILSKPVGYKIICEPETKHYKKTNKSVPNTISFYLEDDNNKEVNFYSKNKDFYIANDSNLNKKFILFKSIVSQFSYD